MTIKETAGKVLLYFYQMQRTAPLAMPNRQVGFIEKKDGGLGFTSDKKWLAKDLLSLNPKATDVYNALLFLLNKNYIQARERVSTKARIYVGIELTGGGIDITEGIERGRDGHRDFEAAFNIKSNSSRVEDLIKEALGDLLG